MLMGNLDVPVECRTCCNGTPQVVRARPAAFLFSAWAHLCALLA